MCFAWKLLGGIVGFRILYLSYPAVLLLLILWGEFVGDTLNTFGLLVVEVLQIIKKFYNTNLSNNANELKILKLKHNMVILIYFVSVIGNTAWECLLTSSGGLPLIPWDTFLSSFFASIADEKKVWRDDIVSCQLNKTFLIYWFFINKNFFIQNYWMKYYV